MKKCLISGSFDPITCGHIDIIEKALAMSNKVVVGVFNNEEKTYLFNLNERVQLCKLALEKYDNVEVVGDSGMVFEFCNKYDIDIIIRGFRNNVDYAYETEMAKFNYDKCGVKTILLPADKKFDNRSSTIARELILQEKQNFAQNNVEEINAELNKYLPASVLSLIRRKNNE